VSPLDVIYLTALKPKRENNIAVQDGICIDTVVPADKAKLDRRLPAERKGQSRARNNREINGGTNSSGTIVFESG
jgi:hypothetical protein